MAKTRIGEELEISQAVNAVVKGDVLIVDYASTSQEERRDIVFVSRNGIVADCDLFIMLCGTWSAQWWKNNQKRQRHLSPSHKSGSALESVIPATDKFPGAVFPGHVLRKRLAESCNN